MTPREMLARRLINQQLVSSKARTPAEVVGALGAVQAQDYLPSLWSVGLRLDSARQEDVEGAITRREIVRTWPMRGTLHFVPAEDARWMVKFLAPRIAARNALRISRIGVDAQVLSQSRKLVAKMLEGRTDVTREEIYLGLTKAGVPVSGQRGLHVLWWLALEGLICLGERREGKQTFVLLDEWVPRTKEFDRDGSLSLLAVRYFTGHGPATLGDFVWWSGLKVSDAKAAVDAASGELTKSTFGDSECWMGPDLGSPPEGEPRAFLLPRLDEYVVGYRDRAAMIEPRFARSIVRGLPVLFVPKVLIDGMIVGTWRQTQTKAQVQIAVEPFARLSDSQLKAVVAEVRRYGQFLGKSPSVTGV